MMYHAKHLFYGFSEFKRYLRFRKQEKDEFRGACGKGGVCDASLTKMAREGEKTLEQDYQRDFRDDIWIKSQITNHKTDSR